MPEPVPATSPRAFPFTGFSAMLTSLLLALVWLFCTHKPLLADPDIGWHLRNGQIMLEQHTFLRHDTYTWTLDHHAWMDPEWLAEIVFYASWKLAGVRGLEVLTIVLLEALTLAVVLLGTQRTGNPRPALVSSIFFVLFASVSFSPRTQLLGWLCCTAVLGLLVRFRSLPLGKPDRLWLLPVLFCLWANLHGSWPIGLVLFALYILCGLTSFRAGLLETSAWSDRERKRLLVTFALCVAAVCINPYGWRFLVYPFVIAGQHKLTLEKVSEWHSLDFHDFRGRFVLLLIAAFLLVKAVRFRPLRLWDAATFLLAVLASFTYARFLLFAGIIVCPLFAEDISGLGRDDPAKERPRLNLAIMAGVLVFAIATLPSASSLTAKIDEGYPAEAVVWLRAHPLDGPLLNDFNWGGYLIWNLPGTPVALDTRTDVFEETGLLAQYISVIGLEKPPGSFAAGRFRYVLFPSKAPLVTLLRLTPGWKVLHEDKTATLLGRVAQ